MFAQRYYREPEPDLRLAAREGAPALALLHSLDCQLTSERLHLGAVAGLSAPAIRSMTRIFFPAPTARTYICIGLPSCDPETKLCNENATSRRKVELRSTWGPA